MTKKNLPDKVPCICGCGGTMYKGGKKTAEGRPITFFGEPSFFEWAIIEAIESAGVGQPVNMDDIRTRLNGGYDNINLKEHWRSILIKELCYLCEVGILESPALDTWKLADWDKSKYRDTGN